MTNGSLWTNKPAQGGIWWGAGVCVCAEGGGGRKVKKFGDRVTCLSVVTRFISSV